MYRIGYTEYRVQYKSSGESLRVLPPSSLFSNKSATNEIGVCKEFINLLKYCHWLISTYRYILYINGKYGDMTYIVVENDRIL